MYFCTSKLPNTGSGKDSLGENVNEISNPAWPLPAAVMFKPCKSGDPEQNGIAAVDGRWLADVNFADSSVRSGAGSERTTTYTWQWGCVGTSPIMCNSISHCEHV